MTIEIRQLVIRGVVERRPEAAASAPRLDASAPGLPSTQAAPEPPAAAQDALVAACVREVLRRLERSRER